MPQPRRSRLPDPHTDAECSLGAGREKKPPPTKVVRPVVWNDVSDAIRRTMQSNRGKDTVPERTLRSLVHSMGYRFRKHVRGLPRTPDLVFPPRRKAV